MCAHLANRCERHLNTGSAPLSFSPVHCSGVALFFLLRPPAIDHPRLPLALSLARTSSRRDEARCGLFSSQQSFGGPRTNSNHHTRPDRRQRFPPPTALPSRPTASIRRAERPPSGKWPTLAILAPLLSAMASTPPTRGRQTSPARPLPPPRQPPCQHAEPSNEASRPRRKP